MLALSFILNAQERSVSDATSIANSFFSNTPKRAPITASNPQLIAVSNDLFDLPATRTSTYPAFYVFNNAENGYVIVSGDERMKPILGYSKDTSFTTTDISPSMLYWLEMYVDEMQYLLSTSEQAALFKISSEEKRSYPVSVEPLMPEIQWNQSAPYNDKCPQSSVTGCVATAMAMIMKYHAYPTKGKGSFSYTPSSLGISLSYDFSATTFDWDNMLPQYLYGRYNTVEAEAVAELMYACGVSVSMEYSPSGSGATAAMIPDALINYFDYDPNIKFLFRKYFDTETWMDMIKEEISESRPILYTGFSTEVGHAFVFDGYDANDMVHVNWGWGGVNNGFFEVSSLNPNSTGIGGGSNMGGGFRYSQGMVIGIQKPTITSTYTSYFIYDSMEFTAQPEKKGDALLPVLNNFFNMSSTFPGGQLALILEKDGVQRVLSTYTLSPVPTFYGYSKFSWGAVDPDLVFPTDVADGEYMFYPAVLATDKETVWSRVLCVEGDEGMFRVVVNGDGVKFSNYWGDIQLEASVEQMQNLYASKTAHFNLKINNPTDKTYYGEVGVGFVQGGSVKGFVAGVMVDIDPNSKDKIVEVAGQIEITAGDYEAYPIAQWGSYYYIIGTGVNVTIAPYTGSASLVINNLDLEKSEYEAYTDIALAGTMIMTGTAPVYDNVLKTVMFSHDGALNLGEYFTTVFIEKDDTYQFRHEFNPNLDAGSYMVVLYARSAAGTVYNKISNIFRVTLVEPTGIADITVDAEKLINIETTFVENMLNFSSTIALQKADIYNVNGQLVTSAVLSSDATQHSVDVSQLSAASYILMLQSADAVYNLKFVKK